MAKFGHKSYVIPFVKQRWASGAAVSEEQHTEAMRKLEVYRSWLMETLFEADDDKKRLLVLPISSVEPHYRDEKTESRTYQTATDELYLSPILGAPDIAVPVGEIPYQSRITGRQELLPVAINVVGAPGMDYWLLDSIKTVLRQSERLSEFLAGKRTFGE